MRLSISKRIANKLTDALRSRCILRSECVRTGRRSKFRDPSCRLLLSRCLKSVFSFFLVDIVQRPRPFPYFLLYLYLYYPHNAGEFVLVVKEVHCQTMPFLQTGFLHGHQANGAFIACGPPGFTALALIGLGRDAQVM